MRYFVAVAEQGQITAAAARLGVTQPAVSQAMRQLERELDLSLLERRSRGVVLTRAGVALLERARTVLATADAAVAATRDLSR